MFNDKFLSVMKEPSTIDPDTDFGKYIGRFPKATKCYNSIGELFRLFKTSLVSPTDAIYPVLGTEEESTLQEPLDEILAHLTGYTQSAILNKGLASQLFNEFILPTLSP